MIQSVVRHLFDPRGRAGRAELLIAAVVMLALEILAMTITAVLGEYGWLPVILLKTLEILVGLSATIKRLHDTGHSGFWIVGGAAFLCMWTAMIALGGVFVIGRDVLLVGSTSHVVIIGLVLLPAIGMTLWLHLAAGDAFRNKYGLPPVSLLPSKNPENAVTSGLARDS